MKRFIPIKSGISDESYHPEKKWISEEESKKFLLLMKFGLLLKLLKLIIVFLVIIGLMIYMIIKIIQKENTYNGLMIMPMMMKVVKY
jgi:hypothetical protein